ncbi:MAG: ABC-F family ATP-binding cassette domain-containing protein [Candidatus Moranbacteria bacterium]|nr:ABC-F family ATP-binding cassette domain-containing protein [Candidatus Moranbacteria bacterium]
MANNDVAIRFSGVDFEYDNGKVILDDASFSLREGMKVALMGQNGAGKTSLFNMIMGNNKPSSGNIYIDEGRTIACSQQVIPKDQLELNIRDFFASYFKGEDYDLDRKIKEVMEAVNVTLPEDKPLSAFSGGQQARLLLASALIQEPDVLLLDEPTNNLDDDGVGHLLAFLMAYEKTCIVISHDADFLNMFTDGVLYLDVFTHKIEQYVGDYYVVVEEIKAQIEREQRKNAQFAKKIKDNKEKMNYFANKGGKMRLVAKKMRDEIEQMEADKVDVRQEDKTIRDFVIPAQTDFVGNVITITSVTIMKDHQPTEKEVNVILKKREHLLLKGPNGIGKTTLLERLALNNSEGAKILDDVKVGYYRQDFSTLNFDDTVFDALLSVMQLKSEEKMRSVASSFLLSKDVISAKIGSLSEGQKGLVAFAQLVLLEPGLLILDEPTNHINFRHIPVIAEALKKYEGAMIVVSHVQSFLDQIGISEELDLGK